MMKKLDERGVAALEFTLVAVPLFTLMFVIFDWGRYAITVQSLYALADAEARAAIICYSQAVKLTNPTGSYAACTGDQLPTTGSNGKQAVVPFLYAGGLTPTVTLNCVDGVSGKTCAAGTTTGTLTITASQPNFTMLTQHIWPTTFNAPSASTSIPF